MAEDNEDQGLDTLKVWQKALAFANDVYQSALPMLPQEEKYILASQIRRAAQSVPANIAEGYGRHYYQETIRFFYIARGSLEETYSHLCLAKEQTFISVTLFAGLEKQVVEIRRLINGYINYLKKSKRGASEPGAPNLIKEHEASYRLFENFNHEDLNQDQNPGTNT